MHAVDPLYILSYTEAFVCHAVSHDQTLFTTQMGHLII